MKIVKGAQQISIMSNDENKAIYFWFNKCGILNLGISYDSFRPFRNLSIDIVYFGVTIMF